MPKWPEHLELRDEVLASDGSINDLQISLGKVVYQTEDVPYRDLDYWCQITEPTDLLIGVFAKVARRLWSTQGDSTALLQLEQGMGGGKSHALVGLWHMARDPKRFMQSDVGVQIQEVAEAGGRNLALNEVHVSTLCADRFSPGKPSELYGPAENLFERFLWSLFPEDRETYEKFRGQGPNKQTLSDALRAAGKPVLILLDELMDYISAASSSEYVERLPDEQTFLNSLFDACDDVPNVVFLLVMIRSELDHAGYSPIAQDLREYIQSRIERNGTAVRVTESRDFMNIIRRRIFKENPTEELARQASKALQDDVEGTLWAEKGFDQLPSGRTTSTTVNQVMDAYPFHPDLVSLIQTEWSSTVGFQRVRSTVRIFSATVLHWIREHEAGRWVPSLIGVGDLPLDGPGVLDSILHSGLLLNNETAIKGFANLASTDVISSGGQSGRAVAIDEELSELGVDARQPSPAVRMATALFNLSLVNRPQGALGATKPELLTALWEPGAEYTAAEEIFGKVTGLDEGLGSLESTDAGNNRNRYWLSTKQTLRAIHKSAKAQVTNEEAQDVAWQEAKRNATSHKGPFSRVVPIERLNEERSIKDVIEEVVERSVRLVVLDPREWSLGNGNHEATRDMIEQLLGLGKETVTYYAACVISAVNSHNRRYMFERARDVVAWRRVISQLATSDEETQQQARRELEEAEKQLQKNVANAYRHFVYTAATDDGHIAEYRKIEEETRTTLRGDHVWSELVDAGRAIERGKLAPATLAAYLDRYNRGLTPSEVVDSFYNNPRHVLVTDERDISEAWDSLVGVGPGAKGGWRLVGKDDQVFNFTDRGQIGLNRTDATFVRYDEASEQTKPEEVPEDQPSESEPADDPTSKRSPEQKYKEYVIEVPAKSLGSRDAHHDFFQLMSAISSRIDPAYRDEYGDEQVVELRLVWQRPEDDIEAIRDMVSRLGGRITDDEPLA